MVKVSIIVPVYNGEEYLSRCLESILAQTLKEIEIIVVDDGSRDCTRDIIKEYQMRYPEIIRAVYNGVNRTLGTSRNIGVSHAKGEYIGFVDADDWINAEFYEKMYLKAKEENADIVCVGVLRVRADGGKGIFFQPPEDWNMELTVENKKRMVVNGFGGMWNNIFRRSVWVNSGFKVIENTVYNEDMSSVLFILASEKMAVVREPLYSYWENLNGTAIFHEETYEKIVSAADKILSEARRLGVYEMYKEELLFFTLRTVLIACIPHMEDRKVYTEFPYDKFYFLLSYVKSVHPDYMKSKYLQEQSDVRVMRAKKLLQKAEEGRESFQNYIEHEKEIVAEKMAELFEKFKGKCLAIWGAGERARRFLDRYDANAQKICYVIDKNPIVQGENMPSGHQIVAFDECREAVDVILVMNHNYYEDIKEIVREEAEVIDYEKYAVI